MSRNVFSGMQVFTTGLSTTLLLILLGTTVFSVLTAHNLEREVKQNLVVTLLLDDEMDSVAGRRLTTILGTEPYVAQAEYISKRQALEEERQELGLDPSEFLEYNPFDASIEIHLAADYAQTDSISKFTRRLKSRPHVTDVLCQRDLVERTSQLIQRASYIMLALAVLLTVISFTLINNTVRLSIHSRRHLIRTMRLVGATWGFIRRPFVMQNFWLGLVSALISTSLIVGAVKMALRLDPSLARFMGDTELAIVGLSVVAAGVLLTTICSAATVSRVVK